MESKEEILNNNTTFKQTIEHGSFSCVGIPFSDALKAMESYSLQQSKKEAILFAKWAKNKGWSYDVWDDKKWHNKANTHFSTTESSELYEIFKSENK